MIDINQLPRTVRETQAPFEYTDKNGETQVEKIRVRYYSYTLAELKKIRSDAMAKAAQASKDPENTEFPWLSTLLAQKVESLPDILDGKKPMEITVENLDKITALNLQAINNAIEADLVPKETPKP